MPNFGEPLSHDACSCGASYRIPRRAQAICIPICINVCRICVPMESGGSKSELAWLRSGTNQPFQYSTPRPRHRACWLPCSLSLRRCELCCVKGLTRVLRIVRQSKSFVSFRACCAIMALVHIVYACKCHLVAYNVIIYIFTLSPSLPIDIGVRQLPPSHLSLPQ